MVALHGSSYVPARPQLRCRDSAASVFPAIPPQAQPGACASTPGLTPAAPQPQRPPKRAAPGPAPWGGQPALKLQRLALVAADVAEREEQAHHQAQQQLQQQYHCIVQLKQERQVQKHQPQPSAQPLPLPAAWHGGGLQLQAGAHGGPGSAPDHPATGTPLQHMLVQLAQLRQWQQQEQEEKRLAHERQQLERLKALRGCLMLAALPQMPPAFRMLVRGLARDLVGRP